MINSKVDSKTNRKTPNKRTIMKNQAFETLSQILDSNPKLLDDKILKVENYGIKELDKIPEKYKNVELLNLASNSLTSLRGIDQFQHLKKLVLTNNNLTNVLEVYHLTHLKHLEILEMTGNPLTQYPGYKDTFICFLTKLISLDGKIIRTQEREKIDPNLAKQYQILENLLENYGQLIMLNQASKRLDLHKSLLVKDKRFLLNYTYFDIEKYKKMTNFFDDIDEKCKIEFRIDLLNDVNMINQTLNTKKPKDNNPAIELIKRQQSKINELSFQIEKKSKLLCVLYQDNVKKLKSFEKSEDIIIITSPRLGQSFDTSTKKANNNRNSNRVGGQKGLFESRTNSKLSDSQNLLESLNQSTKLFRESNGGDSRLSLQKSNKTDAEKKSSSSPLLAKYNNGENHVLESSPNSISTEPYKPITTATTTTTMINPTANISKTKKPNDPSDSLQTGNISFSQLRNSQKLLDSKALDHTPTKLEASKFLMSTSVRNSPIRQQQNQQVVVERERTINNLAQNLKQKIEEVLRLEELTRSLKEKIKNIQDQNEITAKIFNDKLQDVSKEKLILMEYKSKLEDDMINLKNAYETEQKMNFELENEKQKLIEESNKLLGEYQELQKMKFIEERMNMAAIIHEKSLERKCFYMFREAIIKAKKINYFQEKIFSLRFFNTTKNVFYYLKRRTLIQKTIQIKLNHYQKTLIIKCFIDWKKFIRNNIIITNIRENHMRNYLFSILECWKFYKDVKTKKKIFKNNLKSHNEIRRKRKAFQILRLYYRLYSLFPDQEAIKNDMAIKHYQDRMKQIFFIFWQQCIARIFIPKRRKNEFIKEYYLKKICKKIIDGFKINFNFYHQLKLQISYLQDQKRLDCLRKYLNIWRTDYKHYTRQYKNKVTLQNKFKMNSKLQTWKKTYILSLRLKEMLAKASQFYQVKVIGKIFSRLLTYKNTKLRRKLIGKAINTKNNTDQIKKLYLSWKNLFILRRDNRIQAHRERYHTLQKAFVNWKKFMLIIGEKKRKMRKVGVMRKKFDAIIQGLFFVYWKDYIQRKKRCNELAQKLKENNKMKISRMLIQVLKTEKLRVLSQKVEMLNIDLTKTKINARDNLEYANQSDVEKLELISKLEVLSQTMEKMRIQIQEKDLEIESLKSQLKSKKDHEIDIISELTQGKNHLKQIENLNSELEDQIHMKNKEISHLKSQFQYEKDQLMNDFSELEREYEKKASACENLNELLIEKEGSMAKSKKQLEDKCKFLQNELEEQKKLVYEQEKQNTDLQNQLKEARESIIKMSQKYQQNILDVDNQKEVLFNEMKSLEKENELLRREIMDYKTIVKKYEYEIDCLSTKAHQETKDFIENMRRSRRGDAEISKRLFENGDSTKKTLSVDLSQMSRHQDIKPKRDDYGLDTFTTPTPRITSSLGILSKSYPVNKINNNNNNNSNNVFDYTPKPMENISEVETPESFNRKDRVVETIQKEITKLSLMKDQIRDNIDQRTKSLLNSAASKK